MRWRGRPAHHQVEVQTMIPKDKPASWRVEAARLWREYQRTKQARHLKAFQRHTGGIGGRGKKP